MPHVWLGAFNVKQNYMKNLAYPFAAPAFDVEKLLINVEIIFVGTVQY